MFRKLILITFALFISLGAYTQDLILNAADANAVVSGAETVWIKEGSETPDYIKFRIGEEIPQTSFLEWFNKEFGFGEDYSLIRINSETDRFGNEHRRMQVRYKNVPVSDGIIILHIKNDKIYAINGNLNSNLTISNTNSMYPAAAVKTAIDHVNADRYKWEMSEEEALLKAETDNPNASYFPTPVLVLYRDLDENEYSYAWKMDIYADMPLYRADVYVDASTGEILFENNKIHIADVLGTAVTKYSGVHPMMVDSTATGYRLREASRGNGVETYDMNEGTSYGAAVDFTDADNYWNNFNTNLDEVATDAHWGSQMTYDYFYLRYGRNSIDDNGFKLKSYVHYDNNYVNAFWDGQRMTYGDGNGGSITPLTSLDITAHEIAHGLTSYSANLVYQDEPGALNEAFSDIFGAAVEWYAKPASANWTVGEDIGSAFRSMSNPNAYGDPDCYHGQNWYFGTADNGGVHTNSGVLNYWFYLVSVGGSGINDNGDTFNVSGITIDSAGAIAYRMLTTYLTNSSEYIDARFYGIQSAVDLFGPCSPEVAAVTNAFYAIGVGGPYVHGVHADFTSGIHQFCAPPGTVQFTNLSSNATSLHWDFGNGSTSTAINPSQTYTGYGVYTVTLIADGGLCGADTITKLEYVSISSSNPCAVAFPQTGTSTETSCSGILFDSGGGNAPYHNNTNSAVTIAPPGASTVTLNFLSFDFEQGYDYLYIYDGPSTSSTLLGQYDGTNLPNGGTITSTGGSITLLQSTDSYLQKDGFELTWQCAFPAAPPIAGFSASDTLSCSGEVQFTDMSTNGPNSWHWDFGDGTTSTGQHPIHTYLTDGYYTVTLIISNSFGSDTIVQTNLVHVQTPASATAADKAICSGTSAELIAYPVSGEIYWFSDPAGNTLLHEGDTFNTPNLSFDRTFYVAEVNKKPSVYGAKLNNNGGGSYFTASSSHHLEFNCNTTVVLKSVQVYSNASKNRTIELLDINDNVIASKTVNIGTGAVRIDLDFTIPPGNGYKLAGPVSPNLFRNNAGCSYPYTVGSYITITKSSANSDPTGYYYFFYDWEVEELPCVGDINPVEVIVNAAAPQADFNFQVTANTVDFTNTTTYNGFSEWSFGDGNSSLLADPIHVYNAIGTYDVELKVDNGCGIDSVTKQVTVNTIGIEDYIVTEPSIHVFPNPATDQFNLVVHSNDEVKAEDIRIANMLGQNVTALISKVNDQQFIINLVDDSPGIYLIYVQTDGNIAQTRVTIK